MHQGRLPKAASPADLTTLVWVLVSSRRVQAIARFRHRKSRHRAAPSRLRRCAEPLEGRFTPSRWRTSPRVAFFRVSRDCAASPLRVAECSKSGRGRSQEDPRGRLFHFAYRQCGRLPDQTLNTMRLTGGTWRSCCLSAQADDDRRSINSANGSTPITTWSQITDVDRPATLTGTPILTPTVTPTPLMTDTPTSTQPPYRLTFPQENLKTATHAACRVHRLRSQCKSNQLLRASASRSTCGSLCVRILLSVVGRECGTCSWRP